MRRTFAVFPRFSSLPSAVSFSYTPGKGWRPVQRFCFWLLSKIGANAYDSVQTGTVTFDDSRLSLQLLKNYRREVEQCMYEPSRVFVGAEDWEELMGDKDIQSMIRFSAPVDFRNGTTRLMDLDVTIVPWMRGLLVIPKGHV